MAIFVIFLIVVLGFSLFRRGQMLNRKAAEFGSDKAYRGLRNLALQGTRAQFGLAPTSAPTEPWGVVMDWGVTGGTVTVVAFSGGNASVYLSSGGGSIGGAESHESIRKAGQKMVAVAAECQPQTHATTAYLLPQSGKVNFYLLTDAGVFTASATQDELSTHRHPLSKLGDAAQDIITQYRLVQGGN